MRVSELTGALLDYWAGRADKKEVTFDSFGLTYAKKHFYSKEPTCWSPSRFWEQAGPIIERERIVIVPTKGYDPEGPTFWSAMRCGPDGAFDHYIDEPLPFGRYNDDPAAGEGETALIAAMRAFVASKYGETVPDEVTAEPSAPTNWAALGYVKGATVVQDCGLLAGKSYAVITCVHPNGALDVLIDGVAYGWSAASCTPVKAEPGQPTWHVDGEGKLHLIGSSPRNEGGT